MTAHDALFTRGQLAKGETVLVHAVGSGVGTAALQLAQAAGATVIGTSRSGWKLDRATELGLDVAVDAGDGGFADAVREATGGKGADVILDLVGGGYLSQNLASLARLGRLVVVGLTGGVSAELDLGTVLRNRITIVGTSLRTRLFEEKIKQARKKAPPPDLLKVVASWVKDLPDIIEKLEEVASEKEYAKYILDGDPKLASEFKRLLVQLVKVAGRLEQNIVPRLS